MARLLGVIFVLANLLAACGGSAPADASPLLVGAASSLEPLFNELGPAFEEETGAKVVFVYGSSGSLSAQIAQGAPLDVFVSANQGFIDGLMGEGLIAHDRQRVFAEGRLVAVVSFTPSRGGTWQSAVTDERVRFLAIANPEVAPYGAAARQALKRAGLWEQLQPKLVYGANVAQVLQLVQSGNADVGFIALAQIAAAPPEGPQTLLVDSCDHGPLPQVIASIRSLKAAARPELAERFWAFVGSPATEATLRRHGYVPAVDGLADRGCE
jgi:molybdate transport system substrate-binding protein